MAAPLPGWMVTGLLALTGVAGLGLVMGLTADRRRPSADPQPTNDRSLATRHSPLVLGLTFLLTLGLHGAYNLTFVQHQGRYLYPALIPIAVGFVAGLGFWLRPLVRRWARAEWVLPVGVAGVLVGISLFALWRILPGLAPG